MKALPDLSFRGLLCKQIAAFLIDIGLDVRPGEAAGGTFVPGIRIAGGGLVVDESEMAYPGDLLHEAGHLAVAAPEARSRLDGSAGDDPGDEMAAIAWSYAACIHLGLDSAVVFHEGGYRGGSAALRENFAAGRYVGVPMLEWYGLAGKGEFPRMRRWVR